MTEPGLHIVAKPIGPACNLDCAYCFYLEKQALYGAGEDFRMSDEVLAAFIGSYVAAQPTPVVEFVWQGGEPTLLGLDFFRRVVELQAPFAGAKTITNSLQTNGTLLDDDWCRFLKAARLHGRDQPRRAARDPRPLPPRPPGARAASTRSCAG